MDLRNVPSRTDVLVWTPETLSDYFRKLNYKDCEKVVKKHSINGQRFLNMSENDIQKFPKLRVPIVIKLCQEISKNQGKKTMFNLWPQTQKVPVEPEQRLEEHGWSSFEDDDDEEDEEDYEKPDETMQGDDDEPDYEFPAEEGNPESDGDYEPPPPNDEPPHHGVILPSKSIQPTPVYIDRSITAPVPPQRLFPSPVPLPIVNKGRCLNHQMPSTNDDKRPVKPLKSPLAPTIDRATKPSLPLLQAMSGTNSSVQGSRTLPEKLVAKIPKPPLPAEKKWNGSRTSSTSPRPLRPHTNLDEDGHSGPSRPVPPPAHSNTYPLRNPPKSLQKPVSLGTSSTHAESLHSGSLPPQSQQGDINRSYSQAGCIKVMSKYGIPATANQTESSLDEDWYVGNISRQEAEEALRSIDQDGTFLVRNSSKKSTPHPFVLMVLFNDKVYNVQIRYDLRQAVYLLGTGGKEHFRSVPDMIDYFTRTPLLLIDGKDRDLRYHCLLKHSAGRV